MAEFAAQEKIKENRTGIPTRLKERMERRTGLSFDDVRVHYNSDMPARLGALAYTQGSRVEIGPGQERHLPHELGHVVQQKLGLVRANAMHSSGVAMNTEEGLERQADEIGAGRSIHMSPSGNAGMGIVQRYVITDEHCTFAQAPPGQERKVMVRNGEPAAIYFADSVGDVVEPLDRLGIKKTSDSPVNTVFGSFYRFSQKQIPNVGALPNPWGYEDIEQPTEQQAEQQTDQPAAQYLRPQNGLEEAQALMQIQYTMLSNLLEMAKKFRDALSNHELNARAANVINYTNQLIDMYGKIPELEREDPNYNEYIALLSLGQDIGDDMIALNSIATQSVVSLDDLGSANDHTGEMEPEHGESAAGHIPANIPKDKQLALDILIEDITYRREQVELERNDKIAQYLPQIPTGCSASSLWRRKLMPLDRQNISMSIIDKDHFGKSLDGDGNLVHWTWHCATPIHLPQLIGPGDCLFIEDAVGKASDELELANAHWVAHIYGTDENQSSNAQENAEEGPYKKLDCRFNDLSESLRTDFLDGRQLDQASRLPVKYTEGDPFGELEVVVRENMLKYNVISQFPEDQPYMRHFVLDVAKTIADDFVLLAFVSKNPENVSQAVRTRNTYKYVHDKVSAKRHEEGESAIGYTIEDIKSEIMRPKAGKTSILRWVVGLIFGCILLLFYTKMIGDK